MGPHIAILPESLSHRIAAGEVVERPVSVVKELVENSLDAMATAIEIFIESGGKDLIRVIDNGAGIAPGEVPLAFERYATSKIRHEGDLDRIASFGFRGEALPSIAAVSRVTLTSAPRTGGDAPGQVAGSTGIRVRFEGGGLIDSTPVPCAPGTDVGVADLFYNTPVRRKFLRSDATESRLIYQLVLKMSLADPGVGFRLLIDGKETFHTPPRENLRERVFDVMNHRESARLFPAEYEVRGHRVYGFVGPPELQRSSAQSFYSLVNRRVVSDRLFLRSVLDGYGMMIGRGKYPIGVLALEVPSGEIDVNVHPAKLEVRFRNPGLVHYLVKRAVESSLSGSVPGERPAGPVASPHVREAEDGPEPPAAAIPEFGFAVRDDDVPYRTGSPSPPESMGFFPAGEPGHFWTSLRIIGQLGGTYILCQSDRGLVLIDQHAAHERVCFTRLKENWARRGGELEELLLPETVELGYDQARTLEKNLPLVKRMGVLVESMGGNSFVVRAVNRLLLSSEYEVVLREILDEISSVPDGDDLPERKLEPVLARVACHGSIRANRRLDREEMETLLEELKKVERSPFCPHGRPVCYEITYEEIERRFLRA